MKVILNHELEVFFVSGNLTEQIELKRRLHCKSFKWFIENIAYDVLDKYPYLPPNSHWGEVRIFLYFQFAYVGTPRGM
jgi:hypothetical protein